MVRSASLLLFFEGTYRPLKLRGKSTDTFRLYRTTLRNFARYLGHESTFEDLSDDVLTGFLGWFIDRGCSPETANKCAGQILALWRFAARKRLIDEFPDVELLTCPKRVPLGWLKDELQRIFKAASEMEGHVGRFRAGVWWLGLIMVNWYCGERIGAIMQLRWRHIDLDRGWLLVPAEIRKGKRSDKMYELPPRVISLLRALKRRPDDLIFEWDRCPTHIYAHYAKLLTRADLPTDRRSKFHRIRRSTASYYKAAGGDPTELLGHDDPKTTKKYLDPRICSNGKSPAELLFDPTKGEGDEK